MADQLMLELCVLNIVLIRTTHDTALIHKYANNKKRLRPRLRQKLWPSSISTTAGPRQFFAIPCWSLTFSQWRFSFTCPCLTTRAPGFGPLRSALALFVLLDFLARFLLARGKWRYLFRITTIADLVVLFSLFIPDLYRTITRFCGYCGP